METGFGLLLIENLLSVHEVVLLSFPTRAKGKQSLQARKHQLLDLHRPTADPCNMLQKSPDGCTDVHTDGCTYVPIAINSSCLLAVD